MGLIEAGRSEYNEIPPTVDLPSSGAKQPENRMISTLF
jgi:hypothetical protein